MKKGIRETIMVWDPKQETVNVKRLMIYSIIPILSIYATWRIQKFWVIFCIVFFLSFAIGLIMGVGMGIGESLGSPEMILISYGLGMGLTLLINPLLVRHYAQKYNEKIENIGITVESKPVVISRTDDSDDEDDFELCKDPECHLNKGGNILRGHSIKDHGLNIHSEEICSHCYHEEKLHDINLSQADVNPKILDSAGRACIGCSKDGLTESCHNFSSVLKGRKNEETRLEESKRQVEKAEKELEEKKKRKEESRNKMNGDEKLEESKRQVEKAEKELEEKKKKKEESRHNREIDKQIAINEEKIRKIKEESKNLDEED